MVYINSLRKNVFPNYLPPFDDELFSSWICRLSHNHEVKSRTFLKNYLPNNVVNLWNRDIDLLGPDYLKKLLVDHTPLSSTEINNLFISKYKGRVFIRESAITMNVLCIGINHRQRMRFGQQCCILCLAEGSPYYKIKWRFSSSIVCLKHKCILIDRCPDCSSPISFFRHEFGGNHSVLDVNPEFFTKCYYCQANIHEFAPEPASLMSLNHQKRVDYIIDKGMYKEESSIIYLNTLHALSTRLVSNSKNNRFRKAILDYYKVEFPIIHIPSRFWSVKQRYMIYTYISNLIHKRFNELPFVFTNYKVTKSSITNSEYSLIECLNNILYTHHY